MATNDLLSSAIGFGIKEVADVAFYPVGSIDVDSNGNIGKAKDYTASGDLVPLMILDTLKVSTIENTAEQAEAKGGKGNAPLIIWDYGREVTISLQDAVLSNKTLSMMFENDAANADNVITISANTFPGTYSVVGKTFARDAKTGKDHLFTWFVPKAKVNSEVTLTMEAEGDPTVFDMNLRVLRTEDGTMVKLIRNTDALETAYKPETDLKVSQEYSGTTGGNNNVGGGDDVNVNGDDDENGET